MQLAQYYIGALVLGGVLSASALLLGSFGRREGEGFTPTGWVSALASGLVAFGAAGLAAIVWGTAVDGQQRSLWTAGAAGVVGALVGLGLQRWARRAVARCAAPGEPSLAPGPDSP